MQNHLICTLFFSIVGHSALRATALYISQTDLQVQIGQRLIPLWTYKLQSNNGPKGENFNDCYSHKPGHFPSEQI